MPSLMQLKRNYFGSHALTLGYTTTQVDRMTLTDLEFLFYSNPPVGGGGGGDPAMGGDLTGVASNAQLAAGVVGATEATSAIEKTANKGAASGYAGLDGSSKVPIANLPTGTSASTVAIGNDARFAAAEQVANKGAVSGYAGLDGSGKVPIAQLPTGTGASNVAIGNDSRFAAAEQTANKNQNSGYAGLDSAGLLGIDRLPAGTTLVARKVGGNWPGGTASTAVRPTARTDIVVNWVGADPSPPIVGSGTGGMLDNVDLRSITQ